MQKNEVVEKLQALLAQDHLGGQKEILAAVIKLVEGPTPLPVARWEFNNLLDDLERLRGLEALKTDELSEAKQLAKERYEEILRLREDKRYLDKELQVVLLREDTLKSEKARILEREAKHNDTCTMLNDTPMDMGLNEYQRYAIRTAAKHKSPELLLLGSACGVAAEGGEYADIIKKHIIHDHILDPMKAGKELGDTLWYIADSAHKLGFKLEDIARMNVAKLNERYADGVFNVEQSKKHVGLDKAIMGGTPIEQGAAPPPADQYCTTPEPYPRAMCDNPQCDNKFVNVDVVTFRPKPHTLRKSCPAWKDVK